MSRTSLRGALASLVAQLAAAPLHASAPDNMDATWSVAVSAPLQRLRPESHR